MTSSPRRSRRILAAALAGALAGAGAASGALAQADETDIELLLEQKVDPEVIEEIDTAGTAELWLRFAGAPDWTDALDATDRAERGEAAVEAALDHAEESQADVVARLEAADVEYETFWGSSTVKVVGDDELLADLAAHEDVVEVLRAPEYHRYEPITPEGKTSPRFPWGVPSGDEPDAPAWNLDQIRAPEVWEEGFTGEGIVVANLDTGVDHTHPALVDQYRGNNDDGTFTHDYNFFDVNGECGGEPCDPDGHGTHTMGTMVGDDGGANRIGVAPGAEWIAATTGDWSLESLLAAGEWLAAPTDSEGLNADPAMAPDVVNNSWGSTAGYDPFYADVIDLWHAAGIIPVFAAGNTGDLGCLTVGSPGVYPNVIAVGATDIDRAVTLWSSKGPGMDGLIKPDLAAPGDMVRSSVPGGEYVEAQGTSMAAPHVAGAVALMMSAAPRLEGDYAQVYKFLTRNASAVDDRSCSGGAAANNVYGHGIVDAYESYEDAPAGKFGSLSGAVTDDAGEPLPGARILFDGAVDRVVTSGPGGEYAFARIPEGTYEVTVSKFLYETATGTVKVKKDGEAVFDAALPALPARTIEGVVVDGSGHGWPLSARVATTGNETATTTDPLTGAFSIRVPEDGDWELSVRVHQGDYDAVTVGADDASLIEVPISDGCAAPGYGSETLQEDFESMEIPEGWTVENRGSEPWHFDYPPEFNDTPASGGFAIADSDLADPEERVDTDLVSPVFDLGAAPDPTLNFASFFLDGGFGAEAEVLISVDGGQTWDQIWHTDEDLLATSESVDLSPWADAPAAQVKFHYDDNDNWAWFWAVDAVKVGCDVLEGGLVTGTVTDQDTGEPIRSAQVTDPATGARADTDRDGRYVLFTDAGTAALEVAAEGYGPAGGEVEVVADSVAGADFALTSDREEPEE